MSEIEAQKEPSVLNASQSNEIARKRKELIKDCIDWYHTKNGAVSTKDCFEYAIKITDEMARKEFIEILTDWFIEHYEKFYMDKAVIKREDFEKLKQSLEENKR